MPVYKFELNEGVRRIEDEIGVDLPDPRRALEHARAVVRELMGGCEAQTRSWRLNVYDGSPKIIRNPVCGPGSDP
jgi:hypothetical protein